MKKLYIYNEKKKCYYYDEAWVDGDAITEHMGQIGTRGRTRSHPSNAIFTDEENLDAVLAPAIRGGYREIPLEDHSILMIEYTINGHGTSDDIRKRHDLQTRMDETLGWTGLGHCDGGSIGSGTMEVCCFVVDFETAKRTIEADLNGTTFGDSSRIYDEGA